MQSLIFGLITGSILALATVGFTMVRQTEGFLNIAHSQYLVLGAFVGVVLVDDFAVNVFVAALATFAALGVIGVVLARLLFDPVRRSGSLILLFTSVGLAYALYGVVIAIFGTEARSYPVDFGPMIELGIASITVAELLIIVLALAIVAGLWLFLNRTNVGNWVRAVA